MAHRIQMLFTRLARWLRRSPATAPAPVTRPAPDPVYRQALDLAATRTPRPSGPRCRWCRRPVRPALGAWIHAGPHGSFSCRETETRMILPTYAAPDWPMAVGRHAVATAAVGA